MSFKATYTESVEAVEGWMKPWITWGGFSTDLRSLAETTTRPYWNSETDCAISVGGETPINTCAIATHVYASAAENYAEDSEERMVLILALGHLLTNLDAHPDLHMNDTLFPANDADRSVLATSKVRYSSLVELVKRRSPELLERIQPLKGSINLYVKRDTGGYEKVGGTGERRDG
jgi:hypothetical protein